MPPLESSNRPHKAVLWQKVGVDRYNQTTVRPGVEISVRWVSDKGEALDPNGVKISLDASVIVGQDLAIGDQLWLGLLEDWYGTGSGDNDTELMEVVTFEKTSDLKGRNVFRHAGLKRKSATRGENG